MPTNAPHLTPRGIQLPMEVPHSLPHAGHPAARVRGGVLSSCPPQILGLVAKGSFGTILKVLDCGREKVCAVKVGAALQSGGCPSCSVPPPSLPYTPIVPPPR